MTIPDEVEAWLDREGHGQVLSHKPVSGGCISQGLVLQTSFGQTFFLKRNTNAPADMFKREAEGLSLLDVEDGPRMPQVHLVNEAFLLLEDLQPDAPKSDYWEVLGRQLAAIHNHSDPHFGLEHDNFLGSTLQPNTKMDNGYEFFSHQRLIFQADLASTQGRLPEEDFESVLEIASNLENLIPAQPPSLIHGDLWSGNAITAEAGQPALIDPAVHFGWAEAELAMTALFGGFSDRFYAAYEEARPLEPGWSQRLDLYNLYHLLNHLNIFGQSYLGQVRSVLQRYTKT